MGAPTNPVAGVPRKGSSKSSRSRNHRAIYIFPARWAGIFFRNYLMKYHGLRDSDHVHRGLNEHVRNMGLMRRKFLILSVEHHLCAALVAKEVWDRTGFLICQWVYCAVFPFVAHSHCAQKEQYSNRARVWSWSPRPCPFLAVSNFIDQLCSFLLFLLRLELSEVATIEAGMQVPCIPCSGTRRRYISSRYRIAFAIRKYWALAWYIYDMVWNQKPIPNLSSWYQYPHTSSLLTWRWGETLQVIVVKSESTAARQENSYAHLTAVVVVWKGKSI